MSRRETVNQHSVLVPFVRPGVGWLAHAGRPCAPSGAGINQEYLRALAQSDVSFFIVIEKVNGNVSAYSPDLPGCIATGRTREQVTRNMYKAIEMHVQGLMEDKLPIPKSRSFAE